jgi:hypothetical protein
MNEKLYGAKLNRVLPQLVSRTKPHYTACNRPQVPKSSTLNFKNLKRILFSRNKVYRLIHFINPNYCHFWHKRTIKKMDKAQEKSLYLESEKHPARRWMPAHIRFTKPFCSIWMRKDGRVAMEIRWSIPEDASTHVPSRAVTYCARVDVRSFPHLHHWFP